MAFCMEASGGTGGVRQRMKNALGRWSAQYQQETPASALGVMDPPETSAPRQTARAAFDPESDLPPAAAPETEWNGAAAQQAETPGSASENGSAASENGSAASENGSAACESGFAASENDSAASENDSAASESGSTASENGSAAASAGSPPEDHRETAQEPKDEGAARGQQHEEKRHEERGQERDHARSESKETPLIDYYEVLQISRNADPETIHRVYRIMVARFHPDNPRTGDPERFQLLRRAYHVLSDPVRRADYDRSFVWAETHTLPIFEMKEFVDGVDGEKNRRLGILSLLYHRRRLNEQKPGVSVLDLEHRMGFPREYLNFTLWYLKSKGYVRFEDNSDYGVTVEGVDYLEANSIQNTIIRELLEAGTKGETGTSACGANN
jgi:hypothetical protein